MNKDKEIVIWGKSNKELCNDFKRIKDLQLRLLICQLKTDIEDLLESYNVTAEKFNVELEFDVKINLKEE